MALPFGNGNAFGSGMAFVSHSNVSVLGGASVSFDVDMTLRFRTPAFRADWGTCIAAGTGAEDGMADGMLGCFSFDSAGADPLAIEPGSRSCSFDGADGFMVEDRVFFVGTLEFRACDFSPGAFSLLIPYSLLGSTAGFANSDCTFCFGSGNLVD